MLSKSVMVLFSYSFKILEWTALGHIYDNLLKLLQFTTVALNRFFIFINGVDKLQPINNIIRNNNIRKKIVWRKNDVKKKKLYWASCWRVVCNV